MTKGSRQQSLSQRIIKVLEFKMNTPTPPKSHSDAYLVGGQYCCPIVKLRQYTLHPGTRDLLIDLFDRERHVSALAQSPRWAGQASEELARRLKGRPEVLKLSPTSRSQLR